MHLYIIRHADPSYNPDGLTKNGYKESQVLATRLKNYGVNKIFSSNMVRSRLTAEPTSKLLNIDINIHKWLMEPEELKIVQSNKEYCIWDTYGETIRQFDKMPSKNSWYKNYPFDNPKVKESWDKFVENCDDFLLSLGYKRVNGRFEVIKKNNDRIAIFTHNGTCLYFLSYFLEIPLPLVFSGFYCWPSSLTDIYFDQRSSKWATPRALCVADTSHLATDNLKPQARGMGDYCPEYY